MTTQLNLFDWIYEMTSTQREKLIRSQVRRMLDKPTPPVAVDETEIDDAPLTADEQNEMERDLAEVA